MFSFVSLAPQNLDLSRADEVRESVLAHRRRWPDPLCALQDARYVVRQIRADLARADHIAASIQWGAMLALRDHARESRA